MDKSAIVQKSGGLTDIAFFVFFIGVVNGILALLTQHFGNQVLNWLQYPTMSYGIALSICFLWGMFVVMPLYFVTYFVATYTLTEAVISAKALILATLKTNSATNPKEVETEFNKNITNSVKQILKD